MHVVIFEDGGCDFFTIPVSQASLPVRAVDFFWHVKGVDQLDDVASSCDEYWMAFDDAKGQAAKSISRKVDGMTLMAEVFNSTFDARIIAPCGRITLGRYHGTLNNAVSGFVLGELTIQGSQWLDEPLRGQGLGSALVDLAEEICELRAVPHGFMGTTGLLSSMAAKSWQGRAARRPVPGMEGKADVSARAAGIDESLAREQLYLGTDDLDVGLDIAERLGLGVTLVRSPRGPGSAFFPVDHDVSFAFATHADGSIVSLRGLTDIDAAVKHNLWISREDARPEDCAFESIPAERVSAMLDSHASGQNNRNRSVHMLRAKAIAADREVRRAGAISRPLAFEL